MAPTDPDGGWGRLGAGLILIVLGALALGSRHYVIRDTTVDTPGNYYLGAGLLCVGLYQAVHGWGFDWNARRNRRHRRRELRARRRRRDVRS